MKATGIVRKLDNLGRMCLPVELRRELRIGDGDSIEVFRDDDCIVLRKYQPGCVICESMDNLVERNGINVCAGCAAALHKSAAAKHGALRMSPKAVE